MDDVLFPDDGATDLVRAPNQEPTDRDFRLQHASRVEMDERLSEGADGRFVEDGGAADELELPFEEPVVVVKAELTGDGAGATAEEPQQKRSNGGRRLGPSLLSTRRRLVKTIRR